MTKRFMQSIVCSYVIRGDQLLITADITGETKVLEQVMERIGKIKGVREYPSYVLGELWVERLHCYEGPKGTTYYFDPGYEKPALNIIMQELG